MVVFPVPAYPFSTNNKSLELSKIKEDNFLAQSLCFSVSLNGKDETIKSLKSDEEIKKQINLIQIYKGFFSHN